MSSLVAISGCAIAAIGLFGVVRPDRLVRSVEALWQNPAALPLAVGFRLALGVLLLAAAPECRFPTALRALGCLSLVAAVSAAILGQRRLRSFVAWWVERPAAFVRAWAAVAVAFGAFLGYAAGW